MSGDKDTKEVLVAVNELAVVLVQKLKEQKSLIEEGMDIYQAIQSPEMMAKLQAAFDNISAVPDELKGLSFTDDVDLCMVQLSYLPKIAAAFATPTQPVASPSV